MSSRLLEFFTKSTQGTKTGGRIGCEIETIFVHADTGTPITQTVSARLRGTVAGRPDKCVHSIDLSRATFELALGPCDSFDELTDLALRSLAWLYKVAAQYGAVPFFGPAISWSRPLVDVSTDPRDMLWQELDGPEALEHLTCASVQFNVDVHPSVAIDRINELWIKELHLVDFAPNDLRWRNYIASSSAGYDPTRYAGPSRFVEGIGDIQGYVTSLARHDVLMNAGQLVRLDPLGTTEYDIDLFTRSVWWHHRLRVRGSALVLETRPYARRGDDCIEKYWRLLAPIFGL